MLRFCSPSCLPCAPIDLQFPRRLCYRFTPSILSVCVHVNLGTSSNDASSMLLHLIPVSSVTCSQFDCHVFQGIGNARKAALKTFKDPFKTTLITISTSPPCPNMTKKGLSDMSFVAFRFTHNFFIFFVFYESAGAETPPPPNNNGSSVIIILIPQSEHLPHPSRGLISRLPFSHPPPRCGVCDKHTLRHADSHPPIQSTP